MLKGRPLDIALTLTALVFLAVAAYVGLQDDPNSPAVHEPVQLTH
jgi:hypothetical protein